MHRIFSALLAAVSLATIAQPRESYPPPPTMRRLSEGALADACVHSITWEIMGQMDRREADAAIQASRVAIAWAKFGSTVPHVRDRDASQQMLGPRYELLTPADRAAESSYCFAIGLPMYRNTPDEERRELDAIASEALQRLARDRQKP